MGTRSTIKFYESFGKDEQGKPKVRPVACIYQQYDGYPSGVGMELAEFLNSMTVVNGFGMNEKKGTHANGMGCLAAQFIAEFKTGIGGFYMTNPDDSQEYNYEVYLNEKGLYMVCDAEYSDDKPFEGTPEKFMELVNAEELT
jgi:hypothetical protein